jgi:glutamate formiminotransferase/formiminotetrahydrofolate cyclodeaminase
VLDVHSDVDHNRTVITFVGEPESVCNAAFAVVARAARLIDMDQQQGQHPRIGATDVLPLVPLDGMTLAECAALARQLGERIGTDLQIPIYLYEAAATHPDRVNLADVRRGEYEGLKAAISSDPDRAPDFGPTVLGSAGATAVGARLPLIAYNVYLTTDDVEIARSIAQKIRYSSGGLPYVKALGLLVKGRAQVSMNLTDYTQTPVHQVMEQIRQEAVRHGVSVHSSELVGLIPQAALIEVARWYLQLDEFSSNQILEERLKKQMVGS